MHIRLRSLNKANKKADIESTKLLLKKSEYKGYCEYLSPISPIYNSKLLTAHYCFVSAFSKYRVFTIQLLASRSAEKATGGVASVISSGYSPTLNMELLQIHYELKQEILDDLIKNIPQLPVSHKIIKRSIHKTLLRQYREAISWVLAFFGVM